MRFYVSTNPQAGDHETEECPECGALIAPGAWMKHRDSHDSARVEIIDEFEENEKFADLVETVGAQGENIAALVARLDEIIQQFAIHEQDHGA